MTSLWFEPSVRSEEGLQGWCINDDDGDKGFALAPGDRLALNCELLGSDSHDTVYITQNSCDDDEDTGTEEEANNYLSSPW